MVPSFSIFQSSHCRETRWRWREHSPSHRQSVSVSVAETRLPGTLQLWSFLCIYGLPHCASENHLLQIGTEPLPVLSDRGATGLSNVFILEILLLAWSKTGLSKDCNHRPLQRPGVTTLIPHCVTTLHLAIHTYFLSWSRENIEMVTFLYSHIKIRAIQYLK